MITVNIETLKTALQDEKGFHYGSASYGRRFAVCLGCGAQVDDIEEAEEWQRLEHLSICHDVLRKTAIDDLNACINIHTAKSL